MRKIICILLLSISITANAKVKLSSEGYSIFATEQFDVWTSVRLSEDYVSDMLDLLPFEYEWPQPFIDGLVLTCMSIPWIEFSSSALYDRMKKCRFDDYGELYPLDYNFTIAAVREMGFQGHMVVYDYMSKCKKKATKPAERYTHRTGKITMQMTNSTRASTPKKTEVQKSKEMASLPKKTTPQRTSNGKVVVRASYQCKEKIKEMEALALKAYWDGNGYSIGYGHHGNGNEVKKGDVITKKRAEELFVKDISACEWGAARLINMLPYKYEFSQGFKDGLVSLIYNCGCKGVETTEFYRRLSRCRVENGVMNEKDFEYAISIVKKTKITCKAHVWRRQVEYDMMKS